MGEELIFRAMPFEKLFMFGDVALRSFPVQIGDFLRDARIALIRKVRGILIPRGGILEVFLQGVQRAQLPREIYAFRFRLMTRESLLDLLFERLIGQHQPALLFQKNSRLRVFDQLTIAFRLGPSACLYGRAG